jgi:hypothetical protein
VLQKICPVLGHVGYCFWGYKPKPDGKTDGEICGYCKKAFTARYSTKINVDTGVIFTVTSLIVFLGSHDGELAKILKYGEKMIEFYIEKGVSRTRTP